MFYERTLYSLRPFFEKRSEFLLVVVYRHLQPCSSEWICYVTLWAGLIIPFVMCHHVVDLVKDKVEIKFRHRQARSYIYIQWEDVVVGW